MVEFAVYSNLFIALGAALAARETYHLLGTSPDAPALTALVFCATLVVYNLDRLVGGPEDETSASVRHRWIDRWRPLLWTATVLASLGGLATLPLLAQRLLWALVPLGVVSLAYCLPLVWGHDGPYRLKDVAGLKIVLITLVWIGATVWLPALEAGLSLRAVDVATVSVERGLFIFAICLPFDIRDMERDRDSEIWTLPLWIGVERTRWLAIGCTVLFVGAAGWHYGLAPKSAAIPLALSAAVTAALLGAASRERGEMYHVGLLDGTIHLQWAFVAGWQMWWG